MTNLNLFPAPHPTWNRTLINSHNNKKNVEGPHLYRREPTAAGWTGGRLIPAPLAQLGPDCSPTGGRRLASAARTPPSSRTTHDVNTTYFLHRPRFSADTAHDCFHVGDESSHLVYMRRPALWPHAGRTSIQDALKIFPVLNITLPFPQNTSQNAAII